ncbi:MAG TPA: quinohemoprotein amine dehydrogenase subunit alpha [Bryobacteraceae bacterium]|nr:quinohemoprotein amine dehydrogenase subunit alpha [Bryobacteraceae bacterium]
MRLLTKGALFVPLFFQLLAQPPQQPPKEPKEPTEQQKEEIESGIPITSELVRKTCSPCHRVDEKLRMSRISWRRTTPEGWEQTIKRMISLNNLKMEPAAAREILRYLADHLGLAPEEARPAAFEVEKRMIEYKYAANKDTEDVCSKCHSMGRVISQRRSKSEWELLIAMHRGYYPLSDFQAFRRGGPPQTTPGPDGRPPDNRHPMDKVIPHLTSALALTSPEWSAWSANMRAPKLAGRWAFSGYQTGKGFFYGVTTVRATDKEDEFQTETRYVRAKTGDVFTRQGKSIVYTGFQWRGRSFAGAPDRDPLREVMFLDRTQRELTGRWFTGAYDEIGIDVTLRRIGNDPLVLGLERAALQTGSTREMQIHGANFPSNLAASAIDFGPGVSVKRVISVTPDLARVEVEVAKDAVIGPRDVGVAGAIREGAAVVYDKIDGIKVRPQAGMARVGGINFPKQFQQFDAIAFSNGPDGKPDTKDDLNLGPVDVTWSIDEYTATFEDDDKAFVGVIDDNGLFTPNVDGPNPKRKNHADNYGDVWVVATLKLPDGKILRARAHLLVTVPLYIKFDQPEVAQ